MNNNTTTPMALLEMVHMRSAIMEKRDRFAKYRFAIISNSTYTKNILPVSNCVLI